MTPHPQPKEFYQIDRMVNAFSRIMKMKLHENMHKGSWEKCTFDYLRSRIDDEIKEFDKAIEEGRYSDAMIEGGDVGNFFAMIGDNIEFGRFKNYTHSRPAPSPDEMEERFISKRQAWEQGYQDGQSSVQHDLHLLRHEATAQARDDVLYDVYLHFVDWYMNPDKYNECNPKECYKYIESLRSRTEGGERK